MTPRLPLPNYHVPAVGGREIRRLFRRFQKLDINSDGIPPSLSHARAATRTCGRTYTHTGTAPHTRTCVDGAKKERTLARWQSHARTHARALPHVYSLCSFAGSISAEEFSAIPELGKSVHQGPPQLLQHMAWRNESRRATSLAAAPLGPILRVIPSTFCGPISVQRRIHSPHVSSPFSTETATSRSTLPNSSRSAIALSGF